MARRRTRAEALGYVQLSLFDGLDDPAVGYGEGAAPDAGC